MIDELIDRFGDPPASVKGLIDIALLRNLASSQGIYEIKQQNDSLLLYQKHVDMKKVSVLLASAAMRRRVMLNAGAKPYLAVKLQPGQAPLDALGEILRLLAGDHT